MSTTQTNKLSAAQLSEILRRCDLPPEAQAAVSGVQDAAGLIAALTQAQFLIEATRIFAHALPKREAVWWACMCALHTAPAQVPEPDRKARELAEQWVRSQADDIRRAAMAEAQAAGFQSPEAWAGVAAFWSGDSLSPADGVKVTPPSHLTGVAVAGAVALASVRLAPERQPHRLARFLASAQDIATGGSGRLPVEAV